MFEDDHFLSTTPFHFPHYSILLCHDVIRSPHSPTTPYDHFLFPFALSRQNLLQNQAELEKPYAQQRV